VRLLGDLGGLVVADLGVERGHQHERLVEVLAGALGVGLDADDAVVDEAVGGVAEEARRLQQVVDHDRLEHVELEVAVGPGDGDGGVVADHLGAHHREGLGLGRVDLARHDRRAGLVLGEPDLADAAARARAEQADVVADVHERHGRALQRARRLDDRVVGRERLELVLGGHEGVPGELGDDRGHPLGEALRGVEAGAHGRAAQRQLGEVRQGVLDRLDALAHLRRVARELLAQRDRGGVHEVGAADLDDVVEVARLLGERPSSLRSRGSRCSTISP
jgi:hypothetical protein